LWKPSGLSPEVPFLIQNKDVPMTPPVGNPYKRSEVVFAWVLLLLLLTLALAGGLLGWARDFILFDEIMHFFVPFAASMVACMTLYGKAIKGARSHPVLMVIVVMLIGVGLGALWEIAEWLYGRTLTQVTVTKSNRDTIIDLSLDSVGALLAGIFAVRLANR
jgi:uncharacterized membrane protein YjdF